MTITTPSSKFATSTGGNSSKSPTHVEVSSERSMVLSPASQAEDATELGSNDTDDAVVKTNSGTPGVG